LRGLVERNPFDDGKQTRNTLNPRSHSASLAPSAGFASIVVYVQKEGGDFSTRRPIPIADCGFRIADSEIRNPKSEL
jgi:hypothetical protein